MFLPVFVDPKDQIFFNFTGFSRKSLKIVYMESTGTPLQREFMDPSVSDSSNLGKSDILIYNDDLIWIFNQKINYNYY